MTQKTIPRDQIDNFIKHNIGFKEGTQTNKGKDGSLRTYDVLTKKNEFGERTKNFFIALTKTICSFGFISDKTKEQWEVAFSKRTIIQILPNVHQSDDSSTDRPKHTSSTVKDQPKHISPDSSTIEHEKDQPKHISSDSSKGEQNLDPHEKEGVKDERGGTDQKEK